MRGMATVFRLLAIIATLMLTTGWATAAQPRDSVTVLTDDTYPPYIFRNEKGELQGIVPDLWHVWSERTGIKVTLVGGDWGEIQRRFNSGEGDVIDNLFRTEARDRIYRFSEPYALVDVPLIYSMELGDLDGLDLVHDMVIGVKDGDSCRDHLLSVGADNQRKFSSYDAMIDAAVAGRIKVFCMDKPPAAFLLAKRDVIGRFLATAPIYSGHVHWAVRRGDDQTFGLIQSGFARIKPAERKEIEDQWLGSSLNQFGEEQKYRYIRPLIIGLLSVAAALGLWSWLLKKQVRHRTHSLGKALDELKVSESRFRTIFDSVADAILIQDARNGRILLANQAFARMFGYDLDELANLRLNDIRAEPHDQPPSPEPSPRNEWRAWRKDGTLFWIEAEASLASFDGATELMLLVIHDITERRDYDERLRRSIEALTRSNADLEQFAMVASHDLREPLRMISTHIGLLKRNLGAELKPEVALELDFAETGAKRLDRMVLDLLTYSQSGRPDSPRELVRLDQILHKVRARLEPILNETGTMLQLPHHLPRVEGCAADFEQLFLQLFDNALKFRHPDRLPSVSLSAEREPGFWKFTIADNGIGLDMKFAESIFLIFRRLHPRESYGGTGIGLALCRRIVLHHGGRIWIDSTADHGCRITFTLPAQTIPGA